MPKNLQKELKIKRKQLQMNVEEVAKIFGTQPHNIYKWEGKTKPTAGQIYNKIEKFIAGFYDPIVENGFVNLKKLKELEKDEDETFVNSNTLDAVPKYPALTINSDIASSAIEAQKIAIDLLKQELARLRAENVNLKEQVKKMGE